MSEQTANNNPLLAPVHGISLRDYAAMVIKISQGVNEADVQKAMGIDAAVWDELNTIWAQRMGEDGTFGVINLYGQYFAENVTHPKLENVAANVSADGAANLEKIKTDRYFYEELCGARQAAYDAGLDGAQWILDQYGISLGDFQVVAMQWMTHPDSQNTAAITRYLDYQQEKQKEYAAKFAEQQGGNVADDVTF